MRLATARDELVPLRDDRVRENPAYLTVVLLARVITRIGTIDDVHAGIDREPVRLRPGVPAGPLPADQPEGHTRAAVTCPSCQHEFARRRRRWAPGGIVTYAADRLYEEVAYVAYHFHWSLDDILDLEHPRPAAVRRRDRPAQRATRTEGGEAGGPAGVPPPGRAAPRGPRAVARTGVPGARVAVGGAAAAGRSRPRSSSPTRPGSAPSWCRGPTRPCGARPRMSSRPRRRRGRARARDARAAPAPAPEPVAGPAAGGEPERGWRRSARSPRRPRCQTVQRATPAPATGAGPGTRAGAAGAVQVPGRRLELPRAGPARGRGAAGRRRGSCAPSTSRCRRRSRGRPWPLQRAVGEPVGDAAGAAARRGRGEVAGARGRGARRRVGPRRRCVPRSGGRPGGRPAGGRRRIAGRLRARRGPGSGRRRPTARPASAGARARPAPGPAARPRSGVRRADRGRAGALRPTLPTGGRRRGAAAARASPAATAALGSAGASGRPRRHTAEADRAARRCGRRPASPPVVAAASPAGRRRTVGRRRCRVGPPGVGAAGRGPAAAGPIGHSPAAGRSGPRPPGSDGGTPSRPGARRGSAPAGDAAAAVRGPTSRGAADGAPRRVGRAGAGAARPPTASRRRRPAGSRAASAAAAAGARRTGRRSPRVAAVSLGARAVLQRPGSAARSGSAPPAGA